MTEVDINVNALNLIIKEKISFFFLKNKAEIFNIHSEHIQNIGAQKSWAKGH